MSLMLCLTHRILPTSVGVNTFCTIITTNCDGGAFLTTQRTHLYLNASCWRYHMLPNLWIHIPNSKGHSTCGFFGEGAGHGWGMVKNFCPAAPGALTLPQANTIMEVVRTRKGPLYLV